MSVSKSFISGVFSFTFVSRRGYPPPLLTCRVEHPLLTYSFRPKPSIWYVIYCNSNLFVCQSYELRFSEKFCLFLIRSFPGSFAIWGIPRGTIGCIRGTRFLPKLKVVVSALGEAPLTREFVDLIKNLEN